MKTKGLAFLLISTFLSSVATFAVGKLSDAYNGIIPDDIKKSPTKLKEWQEQRTKEFTERANIAGLVYDQAERFFAPMTRKGDQQTRALANAVCDFLEQRASKKAYIKEIFEAHQGVNTRVETASQFQEGGIPTTGHHIHMTRQIEAFTNEIQDLDNRIKAYPAQKSAWEEEIKKKKEEITIYEKSLQEAKQKKENGKLEESKTEREIEDTQRQIKETTERRNKIEDSIKKEENELNALKEQIEKVKRS